jgi:hypothetical protein
MPVATGILLPNVIQCSVAAEDEHLQSTIAVASSGRLGTEIVPSEVLPVYERLMWAGR